MKLINVFYYMFIFLFLMLMFTFNLFVSYYFYYGFKENITFTKILQQSSSSVVNISTFKKSVDYITSLPPNKIPEKLKLRFGNITFVYTATNNVFYSLGTGFIISNDGYILTNAHVIKGSDKIIVKLKTKKDYKALLIGIDNKTDIALIKINEHNLPVMNIGNSDNIQLGECVTAIGSPFGFDHSITSGIVSAINRTLPNDLYVPFLQTDVPINPGNSGGPLLDLQGKVIGINAQIITRTGGFMGLSFSIPINIAIKLAIKLKTFGYLRP